MLVGSCYSCVQKWNNWSVFQWCVARNQIRLHLSNQRQVDCFCWRCVAAKLHSEEANNLWRLLRLSLPTDSGIFAFELWFRFRSYFKLYQKDRDAWEGQLDMIYIWKRAISSATEADAIARGRLTAAQSCDLLAGWNIDLPSLGLDSSAHICALADITGQYRISAWYSEFKFIRAHKDTVAYANTHDYVSVEFDCDCLERKANCAFNKYYINIDFCIGWCHSWPLCGRYFVQQRGDSQNAAVFGERQMRSGNYSRSWSTRSKSGFELWRWRQNQYQHKCQHQHQHQWQHSQSRQRQHWWKQQRKCSIFSDGYGDIDLIKFDGFDDYQFVDCFLTVTKPECRQNKRKEKKKKKLKY